MSAFALLIPPACLTTHLHSLTERSYTMHTLPLIHSNRSHEPTETLKALGRRAFGASTIVVAAMS